jgi:flagellar basal-body rod protein FlgB
MRLSEMDRVSALLEDYLNIQSRRAEIVASNLANADTPGFKAKELDFIDYLKTAAESVVSPNDKGLAEALLNPANRSARVVEQTDNVPGIDGNTVDTGREMSTLADSGMQFLAGAQMLQSRFRTLRAAIKEGR